MGLGRNQLCPCGSGLKFKKCCLTKRPLAGPLSLNPDWAVPATVIDDVLNDIFSQPDNVLLQRIEALANSQPELCALITSLSSSLPGSASFPAALSAFAIIWMFERYWPSQLPRIRVASIQRSLDRSAQTFFEIDNPRDITMSPKNQPHIHKFIADTVFDFDEDELDGFDLFTLFIILKTIVDVLDNVASKLPVPDSFAIAAAAP